MESPGHWRREGSLVSNPLQKIEELHRLVSGGLFTEEQARGLLFERLGLGGSCAQITGNPGEGIMQDRIPHEKIKKVVQEYWDQYKREPNVLYLSHADLVGRDVGSYATVIEKMDPFAHVPKPKRIGLTVHPVVWLSSGSVHTAHAPAPDRARRVPAQFTLPFTVSPAGVSPAGQGWMRRPWEERKAGPDPIQQEPRRQAACTSHRWTGTGGIKRWCIDCPREQEYIDMQWITIK